MKVIVMDERDNVATAIVPLKRGERVKVRGRETEVLSEVPQGHKIAIKGIRKGEAVIKYGEIIGTATRDIKPGEHVHVHNIKSRYQGMRND